MIDQYDVIVIGGGVIGSMLIRALSRYQLRLLLIEKEADIGMGASSANTAIVHAGYDPMPGTLKAKMNVAANPMWDNLAGELNFPFERRGDYVVAIGPFELLKLDRLLEQGRKNGVPGMHLISGEEMRHREPNINPQVSGALWAPTGGLCDPFAVTGTAAENAVQNGAQILTSTAFEDFILDDKERIIGVKTSRGDFGCRWAVNAAGLFSDEVMQRAGVRPNFHIKPRRGEYMVLDKAEITINNVLFPVPSEASKGILVTASLHGNPICGPTANDIEDKDDRATTTEGLEEIRQGALKMIPSLNLRHIIAMFSGLRANGNAPCETPGVDYNHDFIIEIRPHRMARPKGWSIWAALNRPASPPRPPSPSAWWSCSKTPARSLREKPEWDPIRPARPRFCHLSREEQARLIAEDPRYARIICRCELVTEGEIVAEINAPIPARTYDALKRRTWLGTGRCLGGFDMPRVVDILARELGTSPLEVTKKGGGSAFLVRKTKQMEGR